MRRGGARRGDGSSISERVRWTAGRKDGNQAGNAVFGSAIGSEEPLPGPSDTEQLPPPRGRETQGRRMEAGLAVWTQGQHSTAKVIMRR